MFSQNLFAGDAGYFSRTCVSKTQRTVLTILNDYSDLNSAAIYTLVIDGVPAVYNLKDKTIKETGDDGVLTVSKNNVEAFKSDFNDTTGKMNLTVYIDPRAGTIAEHGVTASPITVQLQCVDYWPEP